MPFSCDWVDFCLERDGSDPVSRLVPAAHGPPCSILKLVPAAAVPSPVTSACQMIFVSRNSHLQFWTCLCELLYDSVLILAPRWDHK